MWYSLGIDAIETIRFVMHWLLHYRTSHNLGWRWRVKRADVSVRYLLLGACSIYRRQWFCKSLPPKNEGPSICHSRWSDLTTALGFGQVRTHRVPDHGAFIFQCWPQGKLKAVCFNWAEYKVNKNIKSSISTTCQSVLAMIHVLVLKVAFYVRLLIFSNFSELTF